MSEQKVTYCRICEASCGLVATVEDGRLVQLRPDPEHPLSQGFACPKGIAFTDVQNDPDRVLHPLRRQADGTFVRVGWDEALEDIGERLRTAVSSYGGEGIGWYFGNPSAFSYSHTLWLQGLALGLGSKHLYSAGSQDVNNRFAASSLLYGASFVVPIPDLDRTDFLLVVGANPVVSHGSIISAPRMKEQMKAITARGGRVVVVDPRRSETAALFEHVPVQPDGDAWLLLSLLHVVFAEGLADEAAIARQSTGVELLRRAAAEHPPEATAVHTGLDPDAVRRLARDLAAAPSAAVYGRTGSCLGTQGTLVSFLLDALALVTGNLDRPGGGVFGRSPLPIEALGQKVNLLSYDRMRSRIGGFPDVLGTFPAALMAKEMTTPGRGQLRTLFVSAGNPVLSVPNGEELVEALAGLDLMVSLDLYLNETNRHADYVLPATTWLEREDAPIAFLSLFTKPFVQFTEAVVPAYGEARPEWEVIEELARRAGVPLFAPPLAGRRVSRVVAGGQRLLSAVAPLTPRRALALAFRVGNGQGPRGWLRGGRLSLAEVAAHPHGLVLAEHHATGVLEEVVEHRGGKVRLDPPPIAAELDRLAERGRQAPDEDYPLRLIGLRELRSHNSWMHNAPTLMKGKRRHGMRIHPKDAADLGVTDGQECTVASRHGRIALPAMVTEEVRPGTVAIPHGWGHAGGGWQRANAAGGANVNQLASTDPDDLERLAGMAVLNGIRVAVAPA